MNRGLTPLMLCLPEILSGINDHQLHGRFISGAFAARHFYSLPDPELAIDKAIKHFHLIQDPDEGATYYLECASDFKKAEDFCRFAVSVAWQSNSHTAKLRPLSGLGLIEFQRGDYSRALQLAQETYRIARASGNIRQIWGKITKLAKLLSF
ncbi:hypothetical protein B0H19DRAFT_1073798 [Mycena capillaripes]|nr:hypothetical protein B0H19DRAFT_1073798 [Mycena capillaripes]